MVPFSGSRNPDNLRILIPTHHKPAHAATSSERPHLPADPWVAGRFPAQRQCRRCLGETRRANPWPLLLAVVVTGVTYAIRALRWQYLLAPIGPTRFSTAFRTTVIGFAATFLLPARAGEVIRPYLLARQRGPQRHRRVCDHHPRAAAGPASPSCCCLRGSSSPRHPTRSRAIPRSSPASSSAVWRRPV